MSLVLAHRLDDPHALLAELRHHWRQGELVGLALAEERAALRQAVLGPEPLATGLVGPAASPPAPTRAVAAAADRSLQIGRAHV